MEKQALMRNPPEALNYYSKARTGSSRWQPPLYRYLRSLRLEGLPLFQSTLKGRLHFHLTELPDSEIEMLQRLGLFVRIVRKEQLGKLKPGEGDLGAESQAGWPCPSPPDSRPRLRQVCRRTGASGSSSITIRPISPKKP